MRCSLVLGVMADDRPGIIETMSKLISSFGGEWTDSKMITMGGKFSGILLVEIPCREKPSFVDAMDSLKMRGVNVVVEEVLQPQEKEYREFYLEMIGHDRPGIIREITKLLAKYEINMMSLESRIESAAMSGETMFIGSTLVHVPSSVDLQLLESDFEGLANELMVDIKLLDTTLLKRGEVSPTGPGNP